MLALFLGQERNVSKKGVTEEGAVGLLKDLLESFNVPQLWLDEDVSRQPLNTTTPAFISR